MKFLSRAIKFLYLCLFLFTPLIYSSQNSELFELPKMFFVYALSLLIAILHLINVNQNKIPLFKKSFLNLAFLIFLISQTISTLVSIDVHTSFFGYYSRLNGGLLSLICYGLLFFIIQIYLDDKFLKKIIDFSLVSGFIISLYAIAQHLGVDNNKWVQDVQSRVFSTLGQPNWLAAYLGILLPFGIYKNISEYNKKYINTLIIALFNISFYISILFTKSKSGIIATIITLAIFLAVYLLKINKSPFFKGRCPSGQRGFVFILYLSFILSTLVFKNPIKDKLFPTPVVTPTIQSQTATPSATLNITDSGDIRKIVWAGSLALWKQYPIFGTGTETFAYSYYWARPASHNLTSEWDFLYNKAHNEYLNYLANTGAFGLLAYLVFIAFSFIYILKSSSNPLFKLTLSMSLLSILITNSVGFSVVITSLYLFLLPTLARPNSELSITKTKNSFLSLILSLIIIIIGFFFLQKIFFFYLADIAYGKASTAQEKSKYEDAYQNINFALTLNPQEPVYMIKMGSVAAQIAASANLSKDQDLVDQFSKIAISYTAAATKVSPTSTNFWKERAQIYYYLSTIDSNYYPETVTSLLQVASLAPTDAKTFYLIGQFLEIGQDTTDAAIYYQKAIDLKSNYDHAYYSLGIIQFNDKNYDLAKANFEKALQIAPTNSQAKDYLEKISKL